MNMKPAPCSNISCVKWTETGNTIFLYIQFSSHAGIAERLNAYCSKECMEETIREVEKNDDPMTALVITSRTHISVNPEIHGITCKHKYDLKVI